MTRTAQVREYFKEMGESTSGACARALGISPAVVYRCISHLLGQGWLTRPEDRSRGLYRFRQPEPYERGPAAELQEKIWRAARISRSFTVFEIATLSGATIDYVKKYISFLMKRGHVRKIGRDGRKALYRPSADAPHEAPRFRHHRVVNNEAARQEMLDLGWAMMRAMRDGDMAQARRVHEQIGEKFSNSFGKKRGKQNGNNHGHTGP